ncbi:MAG: energy-coupling factor transporter transmembrane component T family protein [Saccharofermentanales bacterium]|jgi:energy-coupling factor transport system permease protein
MSRSKRRRIGRLHPFTLFLLTILISCLVFMADRPVYFAMLTFSFILLTDASIGDGIKRMVVYGCLYAAMRLLLHLGNGYVTGVFLMLVMLVLKIFPIFNIGRVLMLTSSSKLLAAIRQCKLPNAVAVGFMTSLRFLDEMKTRTRTIHQGMKTRGLKPSLLHPMASFELYFVPLVYKCLHVSDTLTSSLITKGIEYQGEKSSYHEMTFGAYDKLSLLVAFSLLGYTIWTSCK